MTRVMVLCLSEATPDLAWPWMDDGTMPALADLARTGTRTVTRYDTPYLLTPQLWATVGTGRSAGHHGVFDYWQRDGRGRFAATDGSWVRAPQVWELASGARRRSCVVNVPATYPPRAIDGIVIAGQDAPGAHRSIASPEWVYDDLVARFGPYRFKDIFPGGKRRDGYIELLESAIEWETDVLADLLARERWSLFVGYYGATAMAQHYFWAAMEAGDPADPFSALIERTYGWIDRAIGRLRDVAGPDVATIVMSECGAGPLRSGVQVNTLLERAGLLSYRRDAATAAGAQARGGTRGAVERFRRAGQQHLPERLRYSVARLPVRGWIQGYLAGSDIDWPRTEVFHRGKGEGNLYVNLAGRFPRGSVQPSQYEAVRKRTVERLAGVVDPATGRRAIAAVHRREELYDGPYTDFAPDLIIEWDQAAYMPTEQDRQKDEVFVERWREFMEWPTSGSHRRDGVFVAGGAGISPGASLDHVRLLDIAPTLLHAVRAPVPPELEGRPLVELLAP